MRQTTHPMQTRLEFPVLPPAPKPEIIRNKPMSARDQIECFHSEHAIRIMYAKHKAGMGKSAKLDDVPTYLVTEATAKRNDEYVLSYATVIDTLAAVWDSFKRR